MTQTERIWRLESASRDAEELQWALVAAHADHLERTRQLLQLDLTVLAGILAASTLAVQANVSLGPMVVGLVVAGAGFVLAAGVMLVVAYATAPSDPSLRLGALPGPRFRLALNDAVERDEWLGDRLAELVDRVDHNAYVVAVLAARRSNAVRVLGVGVALVAVSAFFVVGGALIA